MKSWKSLYKLNYESYVKYFGELEYLIEIIPPDKQI